MEKKIPPQVDTWISLGFAVGGLYLWIEFGFLYFLALYIVYGLLQLWSNWTQFIMLLQSVETIIYGKPLGPDYWKKGELRKWKIKRKIAKLTRKYKKRLTKLRNKLKKKSR